MYQVLNPFYFMIGMAIAFVILADETPFWKILAILYPGMVFLLAYAFNVNNVIILVLSAVFVIINAFYWIVQRAFNR